MSVGLVLKPLKCCYSYGIESRISVYYMYICVCVCVCVYVCVCVCVCCSYHKQIMDMTTATIEEQSEAVQEFYNVSLCA